jgi:hypothetical protein
MLSMSYRKHWPQIRTDLEAQMETRIRLFIANGSFERDAIRSFGKEISVLSSRLDHLDAVERKACAVRERQIRPA